jgi:hypothetical protein
MNIYLEDGKNDDKKYKLEFVINYNIPLINII